MPDEFKQPKSINDKWIDSESAKGKQIGSVNYFDRIREQANRPINPLTSALVGMAKAFPQLQQSAQYQNPLISALVGGGIGSQVPGQMQAQQQEQAMNSIKNMPAEEKFPEFVDANPWAKGMTLEDLRVMGPIIMSAQKQTASTVQNTFNTTSIPYIKESLKSKGIDDPIEQERVAQTLIGLPFSALDDIKAKNRPTRGLKDWKVISNDLGIPTRVEGVNELDNTPFSQNFAENNKLTTDLLAIGKGKKAIDVLYNSFNSMLPTQKQELAKTLYENGVGNNQNIEDEAGFVQRLKGVIDVALTKPAFGGVQGEKLKAFRSALEANIPLIARSLGHSGVLTELDVMKSFGIAPDAKGTLVENAERRRIYDSLVTSNRDVLIGRYTPVYGQKIDMDKMNKVLGFSPSKEPTQPTKIRVRDLATGKTGMVSEKFFDPKKYERID